MKEWRQRTNIKLPKIICQHLPEQSRPKESLGVGHNIRLFEGRHR
jgi:hypothetical protein